MDDLSKSPNDILVCVPVYNAGGSIRDTLLSIFAQTLKAFDILVLDNRSSDDTREVLEDLQRERVFEGRMRTVENEENLGRIGNWNRALEIFSQLPHRYCKFVFSGDTLSETALSIFMEQFQKHPRAGIAVARYNVVYANTTQQMEELRASPEELSSAAALRYFLSRRNWAGAPLGWMLSKRGLQGRRFSERFLWAADWKFVVDVVSERPAVYTPEHVGSVNIAHRAHYQKMRGTLRMWAEEGLMRVYILYKLISTLLKRYA